MKLLESKRRQKSISTMRPELYNCLPSNYCTYFIYSRTFENMAILVVRKEGYVRTICLVFFYI